ncbi:MAG: hypothetical protein E6J79_17600 [Deltaproteobacteria bacterium]|nr:MAG: hypothetical protein E6J79_17600 [Deltaproteobacteria bacterium]
MPDTKRTRVALALVAGWPAAQVFAQSCAMCGSSFGPDDPVQRAFSWSILFLMAAPYTLFGAVAGWLFYVHRRAAGRRRAAVVELAWGRRKVPVGETGGHLT